MLSAPLKGIIQLVLLNKSTGTLIAKYQMIILVFLLSFPLNERSNSFESKLFKVPLHSMK